jgi:hypothetical protein
MLPDHEHFDLVGSDPLRSDFSSQNAFKRMASFSKMTVLLASTQSISPRVSNRAGRNLVRLCFLFLGASTCCRQGWGGMALRLIQGQTLTDWPRQAGEIGVGGSVLRLFQ